MDETAKPAPIAAVELSDAQLDTVSGAEPKQTPPPAPPPPPQHPVHLPDVAVVNTRKDHREADAVRGLL